MRHPAWHVAAALYGVLDGAVLLAPSVVLALAAHKGGIPGHEGLDLVLASGVIAVGHGVVAARRLVDERRLATRAADAWIAALDALVVLALAATLLLIVVLGGFAEHHGVLVNQGWPVLALWIGIQLGAVALAEVTGRVVFRWLERPAREEDTLVPGERASRYRTMSSSA